MPLPELVLLNETAKQIAAERKREIEEAKRG